MDKSTRFSQVSELLQQKGVARNVAEAAVDAYLVAEATGEREDIAAALETLQALEAKGGLPQALLIELSNMVLQLRPAPAQETAGSGEVFHVVAESEPSSAGDVSGPFERVSDQSWSVSSDSVYGLQSGQAPKSWSGATDIFGNVASLFSQKASGYVDSLFHCPHSAS